MSGADLGIVPKRANSFGNEAYSTKIMEFMSLGVPMVVSDTKSDRYYFDDSVVRFFESGNPEVLLFRNGDGAMVAVLANESPAAQVVEFVGQGHAAAVTLPPESVNTVVFR